jgi:glycerol-3-phosphate acyltransferase PlsY
MEYAVPVILGYLMGSVSPAALLGRIKKVNMRKQGTCNLGATNTALLMGKKLGFAVMFFDIFKGCLAVILAKLIFAETAAISGLLAGASAVIGHMFPFYMKFKGGKGLAAYGGMVLAYDPLIFLVLLAVGIVFMFIFNYCVALTVSASSLFPVAIAVKSFGSADMIPQTVIAVLITAILIFKHRDNIARSFRKEELTAMEFLKKLFGKHKGILVEEDEEAKQEQ